MQVLVVSGDATERDAVAQSLAANGRKVSVLWAKSVAECLQQIKDNQVDSVLLDEAVAESPEKVLAELRATSAKLPVIMFGDNQSGQAALEVIRAGAADVVAREDLRSDKIAGTVGRVVERAAANDLVLRQISDFTIMNSQEGAFAFDQQYRIMLWNPAMERIFGLKREQIIGKKATDVVPFLFTDESSLQQAKNGAVARTVYQDYLVFQNGRRGVYEAVFSPLRNAQDQVIGIIALVRDVGERALNDRKLNEAQERISQLINSIPNLVWLADQNADRQYFNDKWLEFTGRTIAQEQGRGWFEGLHPADIQRFGSTFAQAFKARQGYHVEYRLRRADGQYRLILESGVPQVLSNGQFFGYMGSCTDISETRLTQQKISALPVKEKSIHHLTSTLDHAPIAVWKLDHGLIITKANPAVASQLGVNPDDLVGIPFNEVVPTIPDAIFTPVLHRGERVQLEAHPVTLRTGERERHAIWDLAAWPLKDKMNRVVGVCVSTTEVTEKQLAVQQREDFVATLVHDLKTPLIGADRTLEQIINGAMGSLDSAQTEVLTMLKRSNYQLVVMVQNLIEVYRYEAGQPSIAFEDIDIYSLLRDCLGELRALAEHKGIELSEQFPKDAGTTVSADRLAIRRVFLNLLDNALKFTPKGGRITVTSEEQTDAMYISVRDTGIGISKNDINKLFQRFWQGETGKRYAPGTGLGLYLCRQIVAAHDGRINVESTEGEGTQFTVMLPRLRRKR